MSLEESAVVRGCGGVECHRGVQKTGDLVDKSVRKIFIIFYFILTYFSLIFHCFLNLFSLIYFIFP